MVHSFEIVLIPLSNTFLLLLSALFAVIFNSIILKSVNFNILLIVLLGLLFLISQVIEYIICFYNISSNVFFSIFFFSTGFHGFHVFLGLIGFLIFLFVYFFFYYLFINFLIVVDLYWHFVDIIWLFIFLVVYYSLLY